MPDKKPIDSVMELLEALYVGGYGSNKTAAVVQKFSNLQVKQYFDTGKGHSGAFYSEWTNLEKKPFEEALKLGFIAGKKEPGYISDTEFEMTELGEKQLDLEERRIEKERQNLAQRTG